MSTADAANAQVVSEQKTPVRSSRMEWHGLVIGLIVYGLQFDFESLFPFGGLLLKFVYVWFAIPIIGNSVIRSYKACRSRKNVVDLIKSMVPACLMIAVILCGNSMCRLARFALLRRALCKPHPEIVRSNSKSKPRRALSRGGLHR